MVELVMTGPYTCISADGCFAIQIDTPDDDAGSSTKDASGPIEWEWDCYDPKYAGDVDKPPVTQLISDSVPSRKVAEVTYAVMSNAREATVKVKFRLKDGQIAARIDGQIAARIGGEITARIDGFEHKYRSVLFRCEKGTRWYFSPADSWFHLELARNVVAVPCGRVLHIELNLQIETDEGKEVEMKVALCFDNGIRSKITDDGNEVEVEVTWYPEIARSSQPPEQTTSKEDDEEKFITTPSAKSGPSEVKMLSEKYVTEVVYTIGDELSFVSFVMDLRRKLADHQDHEDILDGHGLLNLSSSREHPVLAKQRPVQPMRWLHIKLQVVEGKKMSWTTLLMRDDNLYVHGFINQQGVCYQLRDGHQNAWTNILPSTYSPIQLYWGISYRSILGTKTSHDTVDILAGAHLGRQFARKAVRRLSNPCHPDDEAPGMMRARLALSGLILMVCESARMNPLLDFFVRGWGDGTRFTEELMDRYVSKYGDMSSELMTWKSGCYAESNPIKELQAVYLVLNTMRIRFDKTDQHYQRWKPGRDGSSSKKPGNAGSGGGPPSHRRGGSSNVGRGGGKRKRASNDRSSDSSQRHQRKKPYNASSSGKPTCKSEEASDAGSVGGSDSKSQESSDADSGGSPDSQSEESSDAGRPGESDSEETGDDSGSSGGNNSGQPGDGEVDDDTQCLRRPRVELLSMRADLGVIGNKITVFDGKRGQIIYTKEEQGEEGKLVDLELTGPYKGISAYGCFAIVSDIIPGDTAAGSSSGDAGGSIKWEWNCYDPDYAKEVDQPPATRDIKAQDGSKVAEVIYAVMSNAREATVKQVKLRLKDGPSHGAISGEITALIDGFQDEHKSVLFRRAKGKVQSFSTTNDDSWFLLELARNVVAVPCGRVLHIEVNLQIETDDGKEVELKARRLNFDNGIWSTQTDDGNEVEVEVTWYPEIARPNHPPEQITKAGGSGPPKVKMVPEHLNVEYTVGDVVSFTEFIMDLRRILAAHPDREDVLDESPRYSNIFSTRVHPVLAKQRAEQPARWIHIKLQAVKGDEMSSTTLLMRDDNLYVHGFMNQKGDWYELLDSKDSSNMVPNEFNPERLHWGIKYRTLLRARDNNETMLIMHKHAQLGQTFAVDAVRALSRYPNWVAASALEPRCALVGLIVMVCECARMNPLHNCFVDMWTSNKTDSWNFAYIWKYGKMSQCLREWKRRNYAGQLRNVFLDLRAVCLVLDTRLPLEADNADSGRAGHSKGPTDDRDYLGLKDDRDYLGLKDDRDYLHKHQGRPRVEVLAMRGDFGVLGTKIIVFDGKRGQTIYRKTEQGEQGMVDLVLSGPDTGISAYGCFTIKIDIPDGTTTGNNNAIKWEWDCYNPTFAAEIDKPEPMSRTISSSGPGRNVEVTYAVMSNALEAKVQVIMPHVYLNRHCSIHGNIYARIGAFKKRIILFRRTQEMGQCFFTTDDSPVLQLARSVVAVPCGWTLHIEVDLLQIETSSSNQGVKRHFKFTRRLTDQPPKLEDDEVEVNVTWSPDASIYDSCQQMSQSEF